MADHKGCCKFLVDFKTFDQNTGEYLPQKPVKPVFDNGYITQLLRDYAKSQKIKDAKLAKSMPKVIERITNEVVKDDKPKAKYSERYNSAEENHDILTMASKVESGKFEANERVVLGTVSPTISKQIHNLTGINVNGYKVAIEARQINHILKDHGKQGLTDRSMANPSDIAKMEYALNDPDDIRKAGKTQAYTHMVNGRNRTADTVLYEKNIGTKSYYVVQAVPDTKAKTLYIVTAFIGKEGYKKEAPQLINATSLDVTAKTGSADASTNTVSQSSDSVKRKLSERNKVSEIKASQYQDMVNHFGMTRNFDVAGYMLGNGAMLDFSGKHWGDDYSTSRQVDHRDIQEVLESENNGVDVMVNMIANGNIRLMPETGGINLAVMPNETQINRLKDYIRHFKGEVIVDIDAVGGDTIHSFTYNRETNPAAVIRDIKAYFEDGTIPQAQPDYRQFLYSDRVTDKKTIDFLEDQEHITTYKAMQLIDGKLYPPMAAKVRGDDGKYRLTNPSELGVWQQAVEDPSNIKFNDKGIGYYTLNKGNGKSISAAYNPYEHSSNLVLNDQFEEAYQRDNLVTVECVIPASEMSSGYQAQYAKDPTGMLDWKAGVVAGKLKDNPRKVYLSRWLKPVRILTDAETASKYREILGENVSVPFNVVSPSLLTELEKAGVSIDYKGSPLYKSLQKRKAAGSSEKRQERSTDSNRILLANALETTVQNDIEAKKLAEYKEKINLIDAEQQKLAEINAEIKELSFSKGKRDTEKLKSLRFDAVQAANRINTFDRQLLNLESTKVLKRVLEREKGLARKRQKQENVQTLKEYREKFEAEKQ